MSLPTSHVSNAPAIDNKLDRYRLPSSAHIGKARLAVYDLAQSIRFYSEIIGLAVLRKEGLFAALGAQDSDRVLLELEQYPGVREIGTRARLGLYHTAFLLPTRADLSAFVNHLNALRVRYGAGDHLVSEAIYLVDPDGLQVEVYADRPRENWRYDKSEFVMATDPVRFEELALAAEAVWRGAPSGTTVGHVHLFVGDLAEAKKFYHRGLGLDVTVSRYPGALFTSAGGYHHHVGLNVWAAGSPVASEQDARLLFWEMALPDEEAIAKTAESMRSEGYRETVSIHGKRAFTDAWGITVALVVG